MATNTNRLHRYRPSPHLILYYLVVDRHGVVDRFPLKDRKSCPIPPNIMDFCVFPSIIEFDSTSPEAKFFTFATISTYGAALYGACLRVFEASTQLSSSAVYNPKVLMILSEHKHFSLFEVFLGYFYLASRKKNDRSASPDVPIEYYLTQAESVELPPDEGEGQQLLLKFGADVLPITIRPRFVPPALSFSFSSLFERLSVHTIALILQNILCEKQTMFVSKDISILTPVQNLLLSMIHPLKWYHLYLPVASRRHFEGLISYKQPFISGTHTDIFNPRSNALAINLDDGCVTSRDEAQLYHCEELEQLISILENFPREKSDISLFQCEVQRIIVSLLQISIRPKESKTICLKAFVQQIRSSLAAKLFIADYRRYFPGDFRLSNLHPVFEAQSKRLQSEKVGPMFEPKIFSKDIRDYERMYQSHIIPISNKRLDKELKRANLTRKSYIQLKENEGSKQNSRRPTLCNGATAIAADFCNSVKVFRNAGPSEAQTMPLKSWLAESENAEISKIVRGHPLNIPVNSSVESGKWVSSSSDSQSVDAQEYARDLEIDSSMQKLETRIRSQNDSSSEKETDVFEGLSESDHEYDALTMTAADSKILTSSSMLHCLQERNEFDTNVLKHDFLDQQQNHASVFSGLENGKLERMVNPVAASKALTLRISVERARITAACRCRPAEFNE